eukprot:TRINITY_DN3339_c0_g1_i1.p1 TRINITY_DN3339_c0_g1~~TRINITY_DN3339_c0_g1_i1.p1  ORF type:complete len:739 (-),score=154.25 TRINITY_DN3339_c0_g1_i1:135-2351(-)
MSWWNSIKGKLPDNIRALPSQTTTYVQAIVTNSDVVNTPGPPIHKAFATPCFRDFERKPNLEENEEEEGTGSAKEIIKANLTLNDEVFYKEGWLAKQTVLNTTTNKTPWLHRYFIIKRGCLFYYNIMHENTVNLEHFLVEEFGSDLSALNTSTSSSGTATANDTNLLPFMPVQLEGTSKIGYRMNLRFSYKLYENHQTNNLELNHLLKLAAFMEEDRHLWLESFRRISLDSSNPNSKLEKRKGWLMCIDAKIPHWSERFFSMENQKLEYYNRVYKGAFPLAGCEVFTPEPTATNNNNNNNNTTTTSTNTTTNSETTQESQYVFHIKDSKGRILNLSCESEALRTEWVATLKRVIQALDSREFLEDKKTLQALSVETLQYIHTLRDLILDQKQKVDARIEKDALEQKRLSASFNPRLSCDRCRGPDNKYRIISMDGGGMRGVMNCIILDRLLETFPDLFSKINMWVGTSNGGMLAMAFALGFTPSLTRKVLELAGATIFARKSLYQTNPARPKFSTEPLKILCDEIYGKATLSQAQSHVMCPSLLLDNHSSDPTKRDCEIRFYHNIPKSSKNPGEEEGFHPMMNELCSDVVMRTIAAPTYFSSYQHHVDGGLFAHSPASSALTMVLSENGLNIKKEDVIMISLGTGKVNHYYEVEEQHDWGVMQWLPKLSTVLWDGMVAQSEFICKELLGDSYLRYNPVLQADIALDDPLCIPILVETAKKLDLNPLIEFIRKNFYEEK